MTNSEPHSFYSEGSHKLALVDEVRRVELDREALGLASEEPDEVV